jgi:DNA-binding transcriptional regulator YhcF (GntR family)
LRDGGGNVCGHSHAELAARLAVYRETVSKALIQMSEQALIETHRRRITILDDEGLRSLAQG